MQQFRISAPKLAVIGLVCFFSAGVWTAVQDRGVVKTQMEEAERRRIRQLSEPRSSAGERPTRDVTVTTRSSFEPALPVGLAGLALFVVASFVSLVRIVQRPRPPASGALN